MGSFRSLQTSFLVVGVFASLFFGAKFASAATLYLSPASGTYQVGSILSVRIIVSSPSQAINAVSGTLKYPADKLQALALSKSGTTVISLWVQEPSYSNTAGTVDFAGVVLNPGFTGDNGQVITVNFKVIGTGTANVSFSSGSVLANDGNGTELVQGTNGGTFTLVPSAPQQTQAPAPIPTQKPAPPPAPTPSLKAPTIEQYTDGVSQTDSIFIQGTTEPDFTARMYIESQGGQLKVADSKADGSGRFVITWNQQYPGLVHGSAYYVRVDATDSNGQVTPQTGVLTVHINGAVDFTKLALGICIAAIFILLIAILLILYHKRDKSKSTLKEEVKKARGLVHTTFDHLRKNLDYYTEVATSTNDTHELTKSEEVIVKRMERNLEEAERSIDSEVEVIGEKAAEEGK